MEFLHLLEPWMIPIVIMVCVTLIVLISSATNIITTSIKEKNRDGSLTSNKEFLNALREFKEDIDSRVRNLEEVAATEPITQKESSRKIENQKSRAIELDLDEDRSTDKDYSQPSKLQNMLNK